jgi:hypothetical protein
MKYRNQKTIKELLVCWLTAAVIFFCAVFPVSGLCDCDNCPCDNSAHSKNSEEIIKNSCVPDCCLSVSKSAANSDDSEDYCCSCSCISPPSASNSVSNSSLLPKELKMLVFAAFFTSAETAGKPVLRTNIQQSPVFWLPIRLHLFLFVLLN